MVYRYAPLPLEDQNVVAVQCLSARWSLQESIRASRRNSGRHRRRHVMALAAKLSSSQTAAKHEERTANFSENAGFWFPWSFTMVLEEQRFIHEDLERLEHAIADRVAAEPRNVS